MKRIAALVLGLALVGPGCLTPNGPDKDPRKQAKAMPPAPPPAAPAVVAQDVNDKNAADKAKALRAEIERERAAN
jgi:hypothetical protein